jgi:hypothetical protein
LRRVSIFVSVRWFPTFTPPPSARTHFPSLRGSKFDEISKRPDETEKASEFALDQQPKTHAGVSGICVEETPI